MSEGEFEKFITALERTSMNSLNADALRAKLAEVRNDIFGAIHVEEGNGIRRRDINAIKLFAALDKWFGEADASKTILGQELTDYLNSPREGVRK